MTMSVTTAADDAPAASTSGARSSVMPPMATSGQLIFDHPAMRSNLRRPGHRFQHGWIDRTERHVIGSMPSAMSSSAILRVLMPILMPAALIGNVGADEIALAEMHEVRAKIDRFTPIVVDDELAAMWPTHSRVAHLGLDRLRRMSLTRSWMNLRLACDAGDPGGVGKTG